MLHTLPVSELEGPIFTCCPATPTMAVMRNGENEENLILPNGGKWENLKLDLAIYFSWMKPVYTCTLFSK